MHEQVAQWWNGISLRTKITGVTVLLLTLGLIVAGVGTMNGLRNYLLAEKETKISSVADAAWRSIQFVDGSVGSECSVSTGPTEYYLAVLAPSGEILCTNKSGADDHPELAGVDRAALTAGDGVTTVTSEARVGQWLVAGFTPQQRDVTMVVGLPLADLNALISQYALVFLLFAGGVVLLGGALTRLIVSSAFGPLREVEDTAARFAAGDFSQRLGGESPDTEVGRLNTSLNTMLTQIDTAFAARARTIEQMRRFVGDASHELRTPLVSVRGYAELYRMGALPSDDEVAQAMERIEKEAIRMGGLVEDLLELARIDETKPLNLAPIDLLPLAQDAALDAMASAPDRSVTVIRSTVERRSAPAATLAAAVASAVIGKDPAGKPSLGKEPSGAETRRGTRPVARVAAGARAATATLARLRARRAPLRQEVPVTATERLREPQQRGPIVLAEENKIRQVLANLIANAVRFSPQGTPIEIGVTVDEDEDCAILSVADHGEGVPPQIREKIFQRFWRADTSRNRDTGGSGLGLAIVSSIVASHNGSVDVVETPGGGATFRVRLPLLHEEQLTASSTSSD